MPTPRVLILRAPGTNCDLESAYAFERAGATTERFHINRWLENPALANDFQILCIPGGFSYGDDVAAGRILANQIEHHLSEALKRFHDAGKLILGICNGFQVLLKTGLLLKPDDEGTLATLAWNQSGKYEDRWVNLRTDGTKSVFLKDIQNLYLPIAHAEGQFVARDAETLDALEEAEQLVLRYQAKSPLANVKAGQNSGEVPYPDNPNGSARNVAGLSDSTGRVLGLMPHPERFLERTQHPRWTREDLPEEGDGLQLFKNAVDYFA